MVSLRAVVLAAVAFSSTVLAAFEPLDASNMFARSPAQFEPLANTPSTRRHAMPAHGLHRSRDVSTSGLKGIHSLQLAKTLQDAKTKAEPIFADIKVLVADYKAGNSKMSKVEILAHVHTKLADIKVIISLCSGSAGGIPSLPLPSSTGGGPGAGGCGDLLGLLIQLILELLKLIEEIVGEIPGLSSVLAGYLESFNTELVGLVTNSETAVPGVTSSFKSVATSLQSHGFSTIGDGLLDKVVGAL